MMEMVTRLTVKRPVVYCLHFTLSLYLMAGPQSAVCSLQSAVCSLQSAVCSLQSAVCSLHGLRFGVSAKFLAMQDCVLGANIFWSYTFRFSKQEHQS